MTDNTTSGRLGSGFNLFEFRVIDPVDMIMRELADKDFKQKDIALSYAILLRQRDEPEVATCWPKVNAAIIERWSMSGLKRVKKMASDILCEHFMAQRTPQ